MVYKNESRFSHFKCSFLSNILQFTCLLQRPTFEHILWLLQYQFMNIFCGTLCTILYQWNLFIFNKIFSVDCVVLNITPIPISFNPKTDWFIKKYFSYYLTQFEYFKAVIYSFQWLDWTNLIIQLLVYLYHLIEVDLLFFIDGNYIVTSLKKITEIRNYM